MVKSAVSLTEQPLLLPDEIYKKFPLKLFFVLEEQKFSCSVGVITLSRIDGRFLPNILFVTNFDILIM